MMELNGNMGCNGWLYRELYDRAQTLIKAPNRTFPDGAVSRSIYGVLIEKEPKEGSLRIYYCSQVLQYPISRLVLAVNKDGRIMQRMLADVRTLKEVLGILEKNMVLDDLANA